jgi:hypothetical protein
VARISSAPATAARSRPTTMPQLPMDRLSDRGGGIDHLRDRTGGLLASSHREPPVSWGAWSQRPVAVGFERWFPMPPL